MLEKSAPSSLSAEQVTVVLVRPAREGNVGAAARAMKTMGFTRLVLVDPRVEVSSEARALAHGSADVLDDLRVVGTVAEAVAQHEITVGTTTRRGQDRMTPLRLRRFAREVLPVYLPGRLAVVFGPEDAGLSNEDLEPCQFAVEIPTGPLFHSLNLSHAVQVVCYELCEAISEGIPPVARGLEPGWPVEEEPTADALTPEDALQNRLATRGRRMEDLYRGTAAFLGEIGYPNASSLDRAMADIRRVLGQTYMTRRDVQTMLGLFRHVRWKLRQKPELE